ncbi:MAG: alkaline phosphatase, partial [Spirochaetales bacterium]|nr:alkaline phosphatase [Spirochaetales bacterium]
AGYKTTKLFASIDAEGNELQTVSELAREKGKLVGIVTNAELADATPACFSVHNKHRSQGWTKICQQEVVFGADLFMGNGLEDYNDYFETTNDMYGFVEANNMKLYSTASDIVSHFTDDSKMWAIFDATANKFARFDTDNSDYPNLQQMTAYALSWLDAHDTSDQGFVVMIENTYTDHFGHGNKPSDKSDNTYGIVKEVQSCDEAVAIALKYVLEHPDTALIVTADHETGNTNLRDGWEDDFSRIKATSGDHSSKNVPVFAIGKGTEALNSLSEEDRADGKKWYEATPYENARIGQVIGSLLGDDEFGGDVKTDDSSKRSPKFDVTVTEATDTLTFTLDLTGVPVRSGNYIQFKIKPVSASNTISVDLANNKGIAINQFAETAFSAATDSISKDKNGNVTTALTNAFKQAFVKDSGSSDNWYQLSIKSKTPSTKITITLKGTFAVDDVIGMDDLTIQYGSTFGQIVFASEKATAAGACLVMD